MKCPECGRVMFKVVRCAWKPGVPVVKRFMSCKCGHEERVSE